MLLDLDAVPLKSQVDAEIKDLYLEPLRSTRAGALCVALMRGSWIHQLLVLLLGRGGAHNSITPQPIDDEPHNVLDSSRDEGASGNLAADGKKQSAFEARMESASTKDKVRHSLVREESIAEDKILDLTEASVVSRGQKPS